MKRLRHGGPCGVERLEGVRQATFSYERSEAFVTYDATVTTVEWIIDGLRESTDDRATPRTEKGSDR